VPQVWRALDALSGALRWQRLPVSRLAVVTLALGCHGLDTAKLTETPTVVPSETAARDETVAETAATVDPTLVEDFRRWLDQDAWQVDVAWSVTEPRGPCPTRPWRWVFLPQDNEPTPTAKAPLTPATPQPTAEQRWLWVWRGNSTDANQQDQAAAVAALEACCQLEDRVGRNAAILLARLQPDCDSLARNRIRTTSETAGMPPQVIRAGEQIDTAPTPKGAPRVPINTRCAAAETWCGLLARDGEPYETSLLPAGRLLETPGLPDELQGTLWRCLARWLPPDRLPLLAEACAGLDRPAARGSVLHRAALEACVIAAANRRSAHGAAFAEELWPREIARARRHGDPLVRKLYGRWLALSAHPEALTVLSAQRRDTDPLVREAALFSLSLLDQPPARTQLEEAARRDGERDRVVAVEALSRWGADAVAPFLNDDSPAVRCAIARGLAEPSDPAAVRLLGRLAADPHPDVQAAAVTTAQSWPRELGIPPLLEALRLGTLATRQAAVVALRDLTGEDPPVSIDAPLETRTLSIQAWAEAHGWPRRPAGSAPLATVVDDGADRGQALAALEAVLRGDPAVPAGDDWDRLQALLRPADVPAIEQMLRDRPSATSAAIRRELLPRIHEGYAALRGLEDADVHRRREAATSLFNFSQAQALSPALLHGLLDILRHEQDQFVWQRCLEAIRAEGDDAAAQVALLAVHHAWPDVRRLGVAYFAAHPSPEAAGWLLPLFRDGNRNVQLAAIEAAARCGNPVVVDGYPGGAAGDVTGLRPLLTAADHELRWAALVAMATLRDDQAAAELLRQSYDPHPKVRELTARALGETGDPRFLEPLIRWSWTEPADPVKQAILASLDQLTPVEDRPELPAGLAAPRTIDDKIKQWAAWWERHPRRPGAALPGTTAASESSPTS